MRSSEEVPRGVGLEAVRAEGTLTKAALPLKPRQ